MTDPVVISVVGQAAAAIGKTGIVETIRDAAVDFITEQAKSLGKEEQANRIKGLLSDHKLSEQIRAATERAVKRWADDSLDRELVLAVANDTHFFDLPSVYDAIATIAKRPFDPITTETLRGEFSDVLPTEFDSVRVERGVIAFLEILREELAGVADLRDALKTAAEIQTARTTQQSPATLDAILRRIEQGPTPTDKTLQDYLNWVIDQHRYLDPRGTMQTVRQVQVLLEEIYVSLQAEAEPPMGASDRRMFDRELDELMKRDDLRAEEKEDLRENLLVHYARNEPRESRTPIELAQLVREKNKLVILGDPGAGKTTLMRYLALRHAQAMKHGEATMTDWGATRLPLYLRFADYTQNGNGRSLTDFLPTCLRGENDGDPALATLIRERLAQGTCLVLLDGLDEVIAPDERGQIAAQADALIRAHEDTGNRFVVTSRVAGYRTAPLAGDLPHYTVCEMNHKQIKRFLDCWCHAVERFQTPDLSPDAQNIKAQAEIDGITDAITKNPGVRRLAANPLLLRVLALIHRTGARLPQRRIELYRLAADTLIRDWELARGIPQAALVNEADANRLLAELAAWMHQNKPAGIATEGEVREQLAIVKGALEGKDPDHPDVQNAVSEFLSKIRQHTGLFVEREPRRYGFMHLTFEEYFAARWLVAKPRDAAKRIRNYLHRPRWEEPILLAIGFYGMEFPDDVSDLVEQAILGKDLGGPSPYEEILHRDLLFALRVLSDRDVNVMLRKQIVNRAFGLWMDEKGAGKYARLQQSMAQFIQTIQGSTAGNDWNSHALDTLHNEDKGVRAKATNFLRTVTTYPEIIMSLLEILHNKDGDIRASAIYALSNATEQPQVVPAFLSALRDENMIIRRSAVFALRNATTHPEVVAALIDTLRDEISYVRRSVASALRNATGEPQVLTALLVALHDNNAYVRRNVASALRNVTTQPQVVAALIDALHDESRDVRNNAASALRSATLHPKAIDTLIDTLHDVNKDVRRLAVNILSRAMEHPQVVDALINALRDETGDVRNAAENALGNATTQPYIVSSLIKALRDDDFQVRAKAATALQKVTAQPQVVIALLEKLHDENERVRASAAYALHDATNESEVLTALLATLRDENENIRVRAATASALSNATIQPEVVSTLLSALRNESENIRARAAFALSTAITQPEVVTALLGTLHDENETVRARAASALSTAITQPEVVTALLAALHDEKESVRASAASALTNAPFSAKVVLALLDTLCDESERIRTHAAATLIHLSSQSATSISTELVDHIAKSLNLPGLDKYFGSVQGKAQDSVDPKFMVAGQ